ncbi:hypothetical protein DCCM_4884 [Desulfocucumis palustris]|uniref:VCBS repeat-containing protein n=1 Tax=Desulfocucumis palustris TaxID=1898651 RepID=A0A2L2XHA1_9FIRM|nr:hypothetical protein [Desulfocucumis palustris]GBF35749.1 hypothetical protein DCCM_4884 [Desulfocucumis palustris]
MKISSSYISMAGQSKSEEIHIKRESLKSWVGNERPDFEGVNGQAGQLSALKPDIADISEQAKNLLAGSKKSPEEIQPEQLEGVYEPGDRERQQLLLLQKLLEALSGKKIKFFMPDRISIKNTGMGSSLALTNPPQAAARQGWGLEYEYHEFNYEHEIMSFASTGTIKTADGREIGFSVRLNMSREFMSSKNISIRAGDALMTDPLVINYDGPASKLTDTKYAFDLDSDGTPDQISFVGQGSGFLALDLNNDGAINNGGELFGPDSGNGFAELAAYDQDHNNWIDENDEIFNSLRIWTKDAQGNDRLFALGEKGIGAIYLGNVNTPFSIKDERNDIQGQVRTTGIFIRENGSAGTVQQIDLVV